MKAQSGWGAGATETIEGSSAPEPLNLSPANSKTSVARSPESPQPPRPLVLDLELSLGRTDSRSCGVRRQRLRKLAGGPGTRVWAMGFRYAAVVSVVTRQGKFWRHSKESRVYVCFTGNESVAFTSLTT